MTEEEKAIRELEISVEMGLKKLSRLRAGEELAYHAFDSSINAYDYYCANCGKWSGQAGFKVSSIPLKEDAICPSCIDNL